MHIFRNKSIKKSKKICHARAEMRRDATPKEKEKKKRGRQRVTTGAAFYFFTSVFSTAGSPCEPAGCDGAIGRTRKTEADFRRWRDRQAGVAAAAGPIDSPPWPKGSRSARGLAPGPSRPRSPRFPPNRHRTCRCYRDTLFWRRVFSAKQ